MSRVFGSVLMVAVCSGCVATPVPIPIPIEAKELRLSASADGTAVVAGLAGATNGPAEVILVNEATGDSTAGPVTARGTFALHLAAWAGDSLRLRTEIGDKQSEDTAVVLQPSRRDFANEVRVSAPESPVEVTAIMPPTNTVVVAVERTGEVAVTSSSGKGAPNLRASVAAEIGDRVHVFFATADGEATEFVTRVVVKEGGTPPCIDADGDGYGALNTDLAGCTRQAEDCNDLARDVHPEQSQFFSMEIFRAPDAQDYDYDCDGLERSEYPDALDCAMAQQCSGEGWLGTVPACGEEGTWARCVMEKSCVAREEGPRRQGCR